MQDSESSVIITIPISPHYAKSAKEFWSCCVKFLCSKTHLDKVLSVNLNNTPPLIVIDNLTRSGLIYSNCISTIVILRYLVFYWHLSELLSPTLYILCKSVRVYAPLRIDLFVPVCTGMSRYRRITSGLHMPLLSKHSLLENCALCY